MTRGLHWKLPNTNQQKLRHTVFLGDASMASKKSKIVSLD